MASARARGCSRRWRNFHDHPRITWVSADRNCDRAQKQPHTCCVGGQSRDGVTRHLSQQTSRGARAALPTSRPLLVPLTPCYPPPPLCHPLRSHFHRVSVPAGRCLSPVVTISTPPHLTMKCKMPTLPKLSNPIQRRPDGKLTIVGLTPMEWCTLASLLMWQWESRSRLLISAL